MNDLNTATMPDDTVMIEAQEGVDLAIIEITAPTEYPGFAKTGQIVTFTILEHSGEGTPAYNRQMCKELGRETLPHKVKKSEKKRKKEKERNKEKKHSTVTLLPSPNFPKCVIF